MNIFPAIDLFGGQAVRLYQGDYDQMTVYDPDPLNTVKQFEAAGASHLHLVDLEGAKTGQTTNLPTIQRIAAQTGLFVEVGGGMRTEADVEATLALGAERAILGTAAVEDFSLVERLVKRWGARIWPMAGRLAAILAAVTVMGLMFSALQAVGSVALRAVISLAILSGVLLMLYSEGLTRGVADADASHAADKLEKLGRPLSRREEAACYQPMKALCACLIVFGVPLVLGAYLAATAEPYTYALQDLPSWLTGTYGAREDVMAPLAAYAQTASVSARDIIRLIVRLTVLIYINLFPDPQTMAQLVDQLTPLMVLSYPVACMIGYLRAPAVYAKRQSMQRRAKKAAVRKVQKKIGFASRG